MRTLNVIFLSSVVVAAGAFACSSSDSNSNIGGTDAGDTSIPDGAVVLTEDPVEGASCTVEGVGECSDSTSSIRCRDGKWTKVVCRGPNGCSSDGGVVCDRSFDEIGADCRGLEGNNVCSVDKKNILECVDGGVWSIFSDCSTLDTECTVTPEAAILCE